MTFRKYLFAAAFGLMLMAQQASAEVSDYDAIKTTVFNYFNGLKMADKAQMDSAFVKQGADMKALGKDENGNTIIKVTPIADAIAKWASKDPRPQMHGTLLSVDIIHDNAAVATFNFNDQYLDFFQLVKIDGEWKIVNKMYVNL